MNTSDLIRILCKESGLSMASLAYRINQTPQNLNKKLRRETVKYEELLEIAKVLDANYIQRFTLSDGRIIELVDNDVKVKYGYLTSVEGQ